MKNILITVCIAITFLAACNSVSEKPVNDNESADSILIDTVQPVVNSDNSMNSLDWAGNYFGKLPCADCEGIETNLRIENDLTYHVTRKYIGKNNKMFSDTGSFKWNESGDIITLQNASKVYAKFFVGENYLLQLDADGNKITGDLAANYRLTKQSAETIIPATGQTDPKPQQAKPVKEKAMKSDSSAIEGIKWILTELNGKPIEQNDKSKQVIYFMLDTTQHYITGFGGCNQFFGGYKIEKPYQIKFQKMTTTLKACDQMETESELLKVLEKVDNYSVNGKAISLNKAKMAPLARFERRN